MSDKAKNPYPDAPHQWPDRDQDPHYGGGSTDGVKLPQVPDAGTDPPPT
jgi:hypothetical protein